MQQIHHKRNELFEVQFYKDKECTEAFDFKNAKDLYIELKDGDITPLVAIHLNDTLAVKTHNKLYVSYFPYNFERYKAIFDFKTLDDLIPNLSKYIPEDNAVLFLSEESFFNYEKCFKGLDLVASLEKLNTGIVSYKKITIFLPHGTQSKLQKANKVAKELMEKYGVVKVNLCVLHCFVKHTYYTLLNADKENDALYTEYCGKKTMNYPYFNKIITTNSTGILPVQNTEHLQVIDCKEIFEEYLKENN